MILSRSLCGLITLGLYLNSNADLCGSLRLEPYHCLPLEEYSSRSLRRRMSSKSGWRVGMHVAMMRVLPSMLIVVLVEVFV
jgi:hypothetical protein